jgi:guanine nucleotide-binding protein subunit alpha
VRLILDTISEAHERSRSSRPVTPIQRTELSSLYQITPKLLKLRMKLLPLQQIEEGLIRKLNPIGSIETEGTSLSPYRTGKARFKELTVHSTTQWKVAFGKILTSARSSIESGADVDWNDPNDPGIVLNACAEDILKLWNDSTVKRLLHEQKIRLEDMSGLYVIVLEIFSICNLFSCSFLDSVERVTSLRYVPTDGMCPFSSKLYSSSRD